MAGSANTIGGFIINPMKNSMTNTLIDNISKNPSYLYDNNDAKSRRNGNRNLFTSDPVQMVENMFQGGIWLNTYEIPYFGDMFLKGSYSNKWKIGDGSGTYGKTLGGFMTQLGVDFPSNPKFSVSMNESGYDNVSTDFYLINSNDNWLIKNFKFINAIFAGSSWMHMKYCVVRSPNVYHVLCPGRFQFIWAVIDVTVTFVGKLRKNTYVSNVFEKIGVKSIDEDMLWPDGWKININIKSLTPNNFNMYAEYYMNGYNGSEMASLANKIEIGKQLDSLSNYLSDMSKDALATGKRLINDISKNINNAKEAVSNLINSVSDNKEKQKK